MATAVVVALDPRPSIRLWTAAAGSNQPPTSRTWPGGTVSKSRRIWPTSGLRCTIRDDGERTITTRRPRTLRFCWYWSPRSMVNRASKLSLARRSNSPFFVPDQPSDCAVLTRCPVSSAARALGRFSSSRTRTAQHVVAGQLQCCECLVLRDRRKLFEELVQRLSSFEVVEERLNWYSRTAEDRRAPRDIRVAVDGRRRLNLLHHGHASPSLPPATEVSSPQIEQGAYGSTALEDWDEDDQDNLAHEERSAARGHDRRARSGQALGQTSDDLPPVPVAAGVMDDRLRRHEVLLPGRGFVATNRAGTCAGGVRLHLRAQSLPMGITRVILWA